MKILMIAPQPFFEPRGTPISVYQRLQALSALQHQVDLLTYHVGQDVSIPGVAIYRNFNVPFIKKVKLGPSLPKAFLDILLFFQAIVLLLRNRYDVIHSHEEAGFWSVPLARVFHVRHVYDMHSSLPQQLAAVPRWNFRPFVKLFEMLEKWVIDTCDVVITIGADLQERVRAVRPEVTTVLIQNLPVLAEDLPSECATTQELREKLGLNGRLPVVYTGTLERYQGLALLLKSAKLVKEQWPEVLFILVGGDPRQVEHWRHQFSTNGLGDSTVFTGTVSLAESLAYLDIAEILVSPRTTGLSVPLKIYSYLFSGKPIVATDLVMHSQVLDSETAVLVAPTERAFADGILTLAQSPDLRKRLGFQAQQFAIARCNRADYRAKLAWVYQELALTTHLGDETTRTPQSDQTQPPHQQWFRFIL